MTNSMTPYLQKRRCSQFGFWCYCHS